MSSRIEYSVLERYPKAIAHMRSRKNNRRFGLVLGAGVCKDFGIPNWRELVDRIAGDRDVEGTELLRESNLSGPESSRIQSIFQHFKAKRLSRIRPNKHYTFALENDIRTRWRKIVRRNLYRTAKIKGSLLNKDTSLKRYLDIISNTPLTINYNFDDIVEGMLSESRTEAEKTRGRGYETVWDPHDQFASSGGIIYHPNGFLPANPMEKESEELIFSEDAYADQLIDTMTGHYATLLHHLSKYTCLFIGVSLKDSTLRHLLRQNARLHPGHYHYYVRFVEADKTIDKDRQETIAEANFETYNLITLFLDDTGIKALGWWITVHHDRLKDIAAELGIETSYFYYLTGPLAVGKSRVLSYFKSLSTIDEWFEESLPLLMEKPKTLAVDKKERVDMWIAEQISLKNKSLLDQKDKAEGLYVVERSPLDPVGFTDPKKWTDKAGLLLKAVGRRRSGLIVQAGQVIFLRGDEKQLAARARAINRRKNVTSDDIRELQERLTKVYTYDETKPTIIETSGFSVKDVVRRIAHVIHREEYKEAKLHNRLLQIQTGETNA